MTDNSHTTTLLILVLGAVVALPFLFSPMTGLFGWGHMGTTGGDFGHMAGGGWGLGWVVAIAIPLLLVVAVGYLVLAVNGNMETGPAEDEAVAELRAAYARGDIDDEEFENRRMRLRQVDE